jgi:hypothetical protein
MTDADDLTAAWILGELDIYRQEQELKRRRVALAFPDAMGT